jgi:hypothetical protein
LPKSKKFSKVICAMHIFLSSIYRLYPLMSKDSIL